MNRELEIKADLIKERDDQIKDLIDVKEGIETEKANVRKEFEKYKMEVLMKKGVGTAFQSAFEGDFDRWQARPTAVAISGRVIVAHSREPMSERYGCVVESSGVDPESGNEAKHPDGVAGVGTGAASS